MSDPVRWRLDVAYDGSGFSGWARQPDRRTVQATIESTLATVLRVPRIALVAAGRTDAGVHARGQVCHVDLDERTSLTRDGDDAAVVIRRRLARMLPEDVRVTAVSRAPAGFDARFSAEWRRYVYRICEDAAGADPLRRHEVLPWPRGLDLTPMRAASVSVLGLHDFAAYCRRREGATTIRTLHELTWSRTHDVVEATVVADAFCHGMVRALVGAMILVGEGRRDTEWPAIVLRGLVRDSSSLVVDARGLTLEEVGYPPDDELAERAELTRALRA